MLLGILVYCIEFCLAAVLQVKGRLGTLRNASGDISNGDSALLAVRRPRHPSSLLRSEKAQILMIPLQNAKIYRRQPVAKREQVVNQRSGQLVVLPRLASSRCLESLRTVSPQQTYCFMDRIFNLH